MVPARGPTRAGRAVHKGCTTLPAHRASHHTTLAPSLQLGESLSHTACQVQIKNTKGWGWGGLAQIQHDLQNARRRAIAPADHLVNQAGEVPPLEHAVNSLPGAGGGGDSSRYDGMGRSKKQGGARAWAGRVRNPLHATPSLCGRGRSWGRGRRSPPDHAHGRIRQGILLFERSVRTQLGPQGAAMWGIQ